MRGRSRVAVLAGGALGLLAVLVLSVQLAGDPAPAPVPTPTSANPMSPPRSTPAPTSAVGRTYAPIASGLANIDGQVIEFGTGRPVSGALVRLDPFGIQIKTDAGGRFFFTDLVVGATCRWTTVEIRADGFGSLRTVDNPLGPGLQIVTLALERRDIERYVGPPRAEASKGESYCVR